MLYKFALSSKLHVPSSHMKRVNQNAMVAFGQDFFYFVVILIQMLF